LRLSALDRLAVLLFPINNILFMLRRSVSFFSEKREDAGDVSTAGGCGISP
jgi:hypothetical protein